MITNTTSINFHFYQVEPPPTLLPFFFWWRRKKLIYGSFLLSQISRRKSSTWQLYRRQTVGRCLFPHCTVASVWHLWRHRHRGPSLGKSVGNAATSAKSSHATIQHCWRARKWGLLPHGSTLISCFAPQLTQFCVFGYYSSGGSAKTASVWSGDEACWL